MNPTTFLFVAKTFCNDSYDNYSYDSFQKRFFTTLHEMYIIYYINIYNNNIKYILINRKQEKVGYSRKTVITVIVITVI